ncbi:MAG: serine/threonine protein kinase [Polyangiaceae bacterium]|jgi:serine/threonine-protein kinase|nr:serine/threonine protein kinase [Polyangiaceae bacterium]
MPSDSRAGELLVGKYRLEKLLGSGGVGDVYQAQNTLVGRTVAIKLLRPEHVTDSDVVARFMREARAANLARHPNVVDVLDVDRDNSGVPFIVQEYLDGMDLSHRLREAGSGLPVREVLQVMIPVVEAVGLAHGRGVIHRDLKPANVFLARVGTTVVPKLLDFGISYVRPTAGDVRMTKAGLTVGTPAYMSPEQLEGTEALDARTDVWALGVMLYELLAGRLPFNGESQALMFAQIAWVDPPPLREMAPHVSANLALIVHRCLQRKVEHRYPTAAELGRDLNQVRAGRPIEPTHRRSRAAAPRRVPMGSVADCCERETLDPQPEPCRHDERPRGVRPVAAPIERASGAKAPSGLQLATVPPPRRTGQSPTEQLGDGGDASLEAAARMVSYAAVAIVVLTILMLALHSAEGFPVQQWLEGLTGGAAPIMHKATAVASVAGSVWMLSQLLRGGSRLWGLAGAVAGLALLGLSLAASAFVAREADVGTVLDATTLGPWGLLLAALGMTVASAQRGWDLWQQTGLRAKIIGGALALLTGTGLFVAEQLARAIGE